MKTISSSLQSDQNVFKARLTEYKTLIDTEIKHFSRQIRTTTAEEFGEFPSEISEVLLSYLERGGKRIRGALTIVGYEMFGGIDRELIVRASLAIEIIQAYILMMDDIQDRSEVRRGGPTGHVMLQDYHQKHHLKDDAAHFGRAAAMCAFEYGSHLGAQVITELPTDPKLVITALAYYHNSMIVTNFGQALDIYNEVSETTSVAAVNNVLEWKTSYYTFLNSLGLGAILAGAGDDALQIIKEYSVPAGRAFQITDDILGVFGQEFESGKSPLDDIKEGKRTLLAVKALELAPKADSYFLQQCLGNQELSMAEFKRCQEIIRESGALEFAHTEAEKSVNQSLAVLDDAKNWDKTSREFLAGLVNYLLTRRS